MLDMALECRKIIRSCLRAGWSMRADICIRNRSHVLQASDSAASSSELHASRLPRVQKLLQGEWLRLQNVQTSWQDTLLLLLLSSATPGFISAVKTLNFMNTCLLRHALYWNRASFAGLHCARLQLVLRTSQQMSELRKPTRIARKASIKTSCQSSPTEAMMSQVRRHHRCKIAKVDTILASLPGTARTEP